jgi:DNA repair exonuclease SbcCD ATPase subunit
MKKLLVITILALGLLACNQQEKRENIELKKQLSELKEQSAEKDSTINSFFRMLNEIESNITLIMQKEQIIAKNAALGNEMEKSTRDRIEDDINTINELMTKNKKAINYLNSKLKGANFQIAEFEERLKKAHNMIDIRNAEVDALKDQLTELDFSLETLNATLDTLTVENEMLEQELSKHKEALDMAWFALGTRKELENEGVIEKAGGFLGLGKSFKLKADFNEEYFTEISISETDTIPIFAKDAELVTTHPSSSYKLVENENGIIEAIEITDPHLFWGTTKYLVVQLKQ